MTISDVDTFESAVPQAPHSRTRLAFFLFGLAILHGLVLNLMPVMFTTMGATFHVDKAHQALLKSYFFGGSAVVTLVAGYLTQYLGARCMTILLGAVTGTGAVLFGLASTYSLVLMAACLLGVGVSPLVTIYAAVIAARFSDMHQRMYMWVYAFLAASVTVATTGLGKLLDVLPSYHIIFIVLGLFIWFWVTLLLAFCWRDLDQLTKSAADQRPSDTGSMAWRERIAAMGRFLTSGIFTRGALYLMCLLMLLDYLCVSTMYSWVPSFFEQLYAGAEGGRSVLGGAALSASAAGHCVGRIIMGSFPRGKIPDRLLLAGCYSGGVICFGLIVLLRPLYAVSLGLMFLEGVFISAQAPAMSSLAVAKFGQRAPAVIPIYEAFGMLAAVFGPPLIGYLADRVGELGTVLWLVPAAGLTLAAVAAAWELCDRKSGAADPSAYPKLD